MARMHRRLAIPAPDRRGFLRAAAGIVGAASLGGCDRIAGSDWGQRSLQAGEDANMFVQRLLLTKTSLAREFPDSEISPWFKPNGTTDPSDGVYKRLVAQNFESYRLRVEGLVETPLALTLAELRAMSARTQVTRHDCVEGWSAIGKWTGVPLSAVLDKAKLKPEARYIVMRCFDTMEYDENGPDEEQDPNAQVSDNETGLDAKTIAHERPPGLEEAAGKTGEGRGTPIRYYESIDLVDAFHPQTLLAYDLNGKALPVSNGAPLRLRVERQLGYKQAKYIARLVVTDTLQGIGQGKGGYWEDNGYDWYAGI